MYISLDSQQQLAAWRAFIEQQEIMPGVNYPIINSWKRCWGRLDPFKNVHLKQLSAEHTLASQIASFDMISIARPIMEDIYQFIERSDTVVVLVNSAGIILDVLGDPEMLEYAEQFDISAGSLISEPQMGTNGFGLALIERFPVSVVGAEHYVQRFHSLAEAAAPIFDLGGRLVGALGLINRKNHYHPHSLGVTVAGARAIETQRHADHLLAEQNSQLTQLNAILGAQSEAVLVLNEERILMHISPTAAELMGMPAHTLLGRHIGEFTSYPDFLREAIEKRQPVSDVEVNIGVEDRSIACVLSLRYAFHRDQLKWIICTARRVKDVRHLVQQQMGAYASLTLADFPGESIEMRRVRRMVKAAAPAEASILIRGETGTGKTLLASAVHNESPRRDGPFLIIACSSIPGELVISELLGYAEGASSKQPGGRPSKFELAHGGTIYFQDVDVLPLEAQGVLLNVIDLGIVQRLGSNQPIPVEVRVVASSEMNIEELVSKGNFRSDLFYRLSSFEIRVPPLREHIQDLPLLVDKIVVRLSRQLKRQISVHPVAIELLCKYLWPGNLRELEAVLSRTAVQGGFSGVISKEQLPKYILHPSNYPGVPPNSPEILSLDEMEREAIMQAARFCNGNVSEMARVLGVGRTTIWRRLKTFNISPDDYRDQ